MGQLSGRGGGLGRGIEAGQEQRRPLWDMIRGLLESRGWRRAFTSRSQIHPPRRPCRDSADHQGQERGRGGLAGHGGGVGHCARPRPAQIPARAPNRLQDIALPRHLPGCGIARRIAVPELHRRPSTTWRRLPPVAVSRCARRCPRKLPRTCRNDRIRLPTRVFPAISQQPSVFFSPCISRPPSGSIQAVTGACLNRGHRLRHPRPRRRQGRTAVLRRDQPRPGRGADGGT